MKKIHGGEGLFIKSFLTSKFLKVMRITMTLLFLATLQIFAGNSYSQSAKLTLNAQNASVESILDDIEQQSEFFFVFNYKLVDVKRLVDIQVEEKPITKVLNSVFAGSDVDYVILDRQILLSPKEYLTELNNPKETPQPPTITGKVFDENGDVLPGVNIVVKGTSTGVITDASGSFSIGVENTDVILVFSFIGYESQEIQVNNQTSIEVVLALSSVDLEEVVTIGYGTVKKSDLTGSVGSVDGDDLNKGAVSSVEQALQGKTPGVLIRQSTAEPGGELSVRIRGSGSITAGNEPLYVIDGVPVASSSISGSGASYDRLSARNSPMGSLNSNDVESIEILKDASATAIYGSRGANGVVLITTKQGSSGKAVVSYNAYTGIQSPDTKIDLLNTSEYVDGLNYIAGALGNDPEFSADDIAQIGAGTDWQDYVMQNAVINEHNLSVSGGSKDSKYFMSANYFDQDGIVKNTGIKKYIFRTNLEQTVKEKLTLNLRLNASIINQDPSMESLQENEDSGPLNAALGYDPTIPIKTANGEYGESGNLTLTHPARILNGMTNKSAQSRLFGNLSARYEIIEGLSAKAMIGVDRDLIRNDFYRNRLTIFGGSQNGIADVNSLELTNLVSEFTLSYVKEFNQNNRINAVAGVTYEDMIARTMYAGTSSFPSDAFLTNNLGAGDPTLSEVGSNKSEYSLLSYLGRVYYTLFNKYMVTASYRIDGSSRFGEDNKFGYFPSVALGWNMADEVFIPEAFSQLKLRASWGITGNQDIGNYNSLMTLVPGTVWLGDRSQSIVNPARKPNPELKWEETAQWNIGLDYGFLNNRIVGSVEYYMKHTNDLLLDLPLPLSSGYASILTNVGEMKNSGFEFAINSRNISRNNFHWRTTLNFSTQKNEVLDIGDVDVINMGYAKLSGNTTITRVGDPLNSYYGYNVLGFFNNAEDIANSAQPDADPGFPIYEDVNGDNQITPEDRMILGSQFPDFTYGLTNVLTYKNFTLDFFIQGEQGADMLNLNIVQGMFPANFRRNRFAPLVTDQWTPDNTDAAWPTAVNPYRYEYGKVNNLVIEDASYIRLKSLTFSYQFTRINPKILQSLRIYVKGQNIITITDYTGYNPEANLFGGGATARMDWNSYPVPRVWLIGIDVTF